MARIGGLRIALLVATLVLSACGGSASATPAGTHASGSPSPSSEPSPAFTPLPTTRPATQEERAAMIKVARQPAERDLKLGDEASCTDHHDCLFLDQGDGFGAIGFKAGILKGGEGCPDGCGGSACYIYLYQDTSDWHYVNAQCTQSTGSTPGAQDRVYVTGCANVRERPSSRAKVLACLPKGTLVDVDSAPVYQDGSIWWHLAGKGWMAHEFLVTPDHAS